MATLLLPGRIIGPPATRQSTRSIHYYLLVFCFLLEALFVIHLRVLALPFFWDEAGQFIPTALDLLRNGSWIAHSTVPNVHPPGMEAYLVVWYKLLGFSIPVTRGSMLLLAGLGLLITFLLALELMKMPRPGPAFLPCLLLLVSPLFYTQSMMAQLDMPAMLLTTFALLLFVQRKFAAASIACIGLVLTKETGLIVPLVFCVFLLCKRDWRRATYFLAPVLSVAAWLFILRRSTGYWLGNPGFAHYNLGYALQPVHMAVSFLRRIYYLFFAEFRWIGTLALLLAFRRTERFRHEPWNAAACIALANFILVSMLGGAELERYLLPVLPIFYIAVALALFQLRFWLRLMAASALVAGLLFNLFWNPPYPFPYEDNYAMVDFVRLQQTAADFVQHNLAQRTIATAWPYSAALRKPEYGFVDRRLRVIETNDFHFASIRALPSKSFDVLITYTRTWAPKNGVIAIPEVRDFLARFYEFQPEISAQQCAQLGLQKLISWNKRGQEITIYVRNAMAGSADLIQPNDVSARTRESRASVLF